MGRRFGIHAAMQVLALLATSCSLFVVAQRDDLVGGDAADAAAVVDGGSLPDASGRSDLDASPILEASTIEDADAGRTVRSWDFASGCGEWAPVGSTVVAQELTAPRSPPGACRICSTDGVEANIVLYRPPEIVADAGPVTFTVHARSGAPGRAPVPFKINVYSPEVATQYAYGTAGADFTAVSRTGVLVDETAFYIFAGAGPDGCIVVDDVSIVQ